MRIAAVADLHFNRTSGDAFAELLEAASREAQALLLPGDLTDYGLTEEAELLAQALTRHVSVPVIAVLGNHDFESDQAEAIRRVLTSVGVHVLDGDACTVEDVGFVGVKGFAGGFGRGSLGPWGEPIIKAFVHEAMAEAIKLESALVRLKTQRRVVLLHYSPIAATVLGEPPEIYPYMGSSRLEEPLTKYRPDVVVHGHAHNGMLEGCSAAGVPVYNVSLPLLRRLRPEVPPFRLIDLDEELASRERRSPVGDRRRTPEADVARPGEAALGDPRAVDERAGGV